MTHWPNIYSSQIKLNIFIKMTIEQVNILHDFKNYFGGLKLHTLSHTADQSRSHGIPITTDVQMLDEYHKESAVETYADTFKASAITSYQDDR